MIKLLEKADLDSVARLYDGDFLDGWNLDMLISAFDTGRFCALGKYLDGKLVGVITFMTSVDDADLETVFVLPSSRKNGVATELLSEAIKILKEKKIEKFFLEVRISNAPAIGFYEKSGFIRVSVRKKYYQGVEDALVMVKEL